MPEGRSSAEIWHDLSGPPRGPLTSVIRTLTRPTRPPKRPREKCSRRSMYDCKASVRSVLRMRMSASIWLLRYPASPLTIVEHLELVENMAFTVRENLTIVRSTEAVNARRRSALERCSPSKLKCACCRPVPVFSSLRLQGKSSRSPPNSRRAGLPRRIHCPSENG